MDDIIRVENLSKRFGDVKGRQNHLQRKKGELFGYLGVNGAGKSTTINIALYSLSSRFRKSRDLRT